MSGFSTQSSARRPQAVTLLALLSPNNCIALVGALMLLVGAVCASADDEGRILVIGGIESRYEDTNQSLQPMAAYIKERMQDLGVVDVVVVSAPDREHLSQLIRHGRVDWISQTAYNASYFIRNADVSVLSRGWRGGHPTYKSVFFVHKDSPLQRLEDLREHTIAFEHPFSTSAYFVPRIELESHGNTLTQQAVGKRAPDENSIAYTFSRSEYNTAVWVEKGIVDVGVISDGRWADESIVPQSFRLSLRVLHETDAVVRALELVRGDLDADIKERLGTLLTGMHEDAASATVRRAYFETDRFDLPTEQDISRLNDFARHTSAPASVESAATLVGDLRKESR